MTGRGRVEGFFIQSGLSSLLLHDVLEPSPASICDSSEALHRQAFSRGHSQKAKSHWCHFEYYSSSIFLSAYRSGPPGIGRRSHPHLTLQWIFIDNSPVIKDVLLNSLWINFLLWSQLYFYLDVIFLSRTSWTLRKYKTFFFLILKAVGAQPKKCQLQIPEPVKIPGDVFCCPCVLWTMF